MPHTDNGIYWEEHGGGAETLVMLPGFGATAGLMSGVVHRLPEFRVLVVDLPGHGRSTDAKADGSIAHLATTLHTAVRDVTARLGVDGYTLVGTSLGSAVALRIALDHPNDVKSLIGVAPWSASGTTSNDEVIASFAAAYGDAGAIARGVAAISINPSSTRGLVDSMLTVAEGIWVGWLTGGALTNQLDELPQLQVPTTYLVGAKDGVVDQKKQLEDIRRIRGARAVVLSDLGHLCVLEAPTIVAEEIAASFERAGRPRPARGDSS